MRLVISAAGGRTVGAGHVMRSMAVAEAAVAVGHAVVLAADLADLCWVEPWVCELGLELVAPTRDVASLARLAGSRGAEAVLVDSYGIGEAVEAVHDAGSLLASFEDGEHGRREADIVIDYQLEAQAEVRPHDGSTTILRGVAFAPIRAQVRALASGLSPPLARNVTRAAVVMGGTDVSSLEGLVRDALTALRVDVMPVERGLSAIKRLAEAEAVVSAAGVSAYELCHLGIPTAVVLAADNQSGNYDALVQAAVVRGLGTSREITARPDLFQDRLQEWFGDPAARDSQARRARELVDGRGAHRIVAALTAAVSSRWR